MHFSVPNHPCKTFPANQDAFSCWKSSLQDIFCRSGCISPPKIIPAKHFLPIRMHSTAPKSSLQNISCQSGCIPPPKIIPARHFLQIRMHSAARNHPSKTFPADQDAFLRPKSSPQNISCQSGCIPPMKSIWLTYSANPSSRILSHRDIAIVQKIHTSTFYLIKCLCMDIFVVSTACDVNRHRRRS